MPVQESGGSTSGQANVLANFSVPVQIIPPVGGQYSAGFETASLAYTNGVTVWDFRNGTANLVQITELMAQVVPMAIAAASGTGLRTALQLFVGRAYTAVSATGRTALTLTSNNCKLRTSYATPGVEIGTASGTTGITGGTVTVDGTPIATATQGSQDPSVTAAVAPGANQHRSNDRPLLWTPSQWSGPLTLAQNEGARIVYLVTSAAAVVIGGHVKWNELGVATYP